MNTLKLVRDLWHDIKLKQVNQSREILNPDLVIARDEAYRYCLDRIENVLLTLENQEKEI